ncbi:inositol-pentakisphosphate 2-kinase [Tirmania nivea]|nr:inositol-pentakisphosphate 2-kinase [Tirmania nivea]
MAYTTQSRRDVNCFSPSGKTFLPSPPQSPSYSNPSPPSSIHPSPLTSNSPPIHAIITSSSSWSYLSEGASNILYRYTGPPSPIFSNYLLRLRKSLPGSPNTLTNYTALQTYFLPALGDEVVVPTVLARLTPGVAAEFNAVLLSGRGMLRRRMGAGGGGVGIGRGEVDENEEWGMLVGDMSCGMTQGSGSDDIRVGRWTDVAMVEFKPRWLAQSVDAPGEWNVCRSCAVRRMQGGPVATDLRSGEKKSRKRKNQHHRRCLSGDSGIGMISDEEDSSSDEFDQEEPTYCPLDLSSQNPKRIHRAARALITTPAGTLHWRQLSPYDNHHHTLTPSLLTHHFTHWLSPGNPGGEILSRLRSAQEYWGRHGVFTEEREEVEEVGRAMAMRDCSVWVRVWMWEGMQGMQGEQVRFECRVGDLDVKPGKGAGGVYWRNMERRLGRGGWYGDVAEGEKGCRE